MKPRTAWGPNRSKRQQAGSFGAWVGDVSNVLFCNSWIADEDGKVFIYYASSDTRLPVATSTIEQLTDYVMHTPPDGLRSASSAETLVHIIEGNQSYLDQQSDGVTLEKERSGPKAK